MVRLFVSKKSQFGIIHLSDDGKKTFCGREIKAYYEELERVPQRKGGDWRCFTCVRVSDARRQHKEEKHPNFSEVI